MDVPRATGTDVVTQSVDCHECLLVLPRLGALYSAASSEARSDAHSSGACAAAGFHRKARFVSCVSHRWCRADVPKPRALQSEGRVSRETSPRPVLFHLFHRASPRARRSPHWRRSRCTICASGRRGCNRSPGGRPTGARCDREPQSHHPDRRRRAGRARGAGGILRRARLCDARRRKRQRREGVGRGALRSTWRWSTSTCRARTA